jgi:acyl dehydratase
VGTGTLKGSMRTSVRGVEGLRALAGAEIQPSPWLEVTQERVDAFALATDDAQWIHVDRDRARGGPYGATVAHGFLTLSLIPHLWRQSVHIDDIRMAVNYGLERVRFPAPLMVPSRVRAHFRVRSVDDVRDAVKSIVHVTLEREGFDRPVCVAEMLLLHYPSERL